MLLHSRGKSHWFISLLALCLGALANAGGPGVHPALSLASKAKIVFASDRDRQAEIHLMNADGSNERTLTKADDDSPSWSPDGKSIVFSSRRGVTSQLFVMDLARGTERRLTNDPYQDLSPVWSPDGKRIAMLSFRDGLGQIFVMRADGSSVVQVTHTARPVSTPTWSPDGNTIAYNSDDGGLHVVQADGSTEHTLPEFSDVTSAPAWSPDGQRLAWVRNYGGWDIYLQHFGEKHVTGLTQDRARKAFLNWSPDGHALAYVSWMDGEPEIYVLDTASGKQQRLTNGKGSQFQSPAWSPDGKQIAFVVQTHGFGLYQMDADGSNPTPIVVNNFNNDTPAWSASAQKLAFIAHLPLPPVPAGQFRPITMGPPDSEIRQIFVTDLTGHSPQRLTTEQTAIYRLAWSPDGQQVAFNSSVFEVGPTLGVVALDGSTKQKVASATLYDWSPDSKKLLVSGLSLVDVAHGNASFVTGSYETDNDGAWSPNGKRIYFSRQTSGTHISQIYGIDADGKSERALTTSSDNFWPQPSPDGRLLSYLSTTDTGTTLNVMNIDGSNPRALTKPIVRYASYLLDRAWSPDSQHIVFTTTPDGARVQIYVVDVDSNNVHTLTATNADSRQPVWVP